MLLYHTMMSVSVFFSLSDLRAYGEAHGLSELISSYVAQRVLHAKQLCLTSHVHVDLMNVILSYNHLQSCDQLKSVMS